MVFISKILFFFILIFSSSYASILFEKDNILVTDNDIKIYREFNNSLTEDIKKTIKEIYLIKKTINRLNITNPSFIDAVDKINNISKKSNKNFYYDLVRYSFIRNDFIKNYYQNSLTTNDLKLTIKNTKDILIPLSLNNCITIDLLIDIKLIKDFDRIYFKMIKNPDLISNYELDSKIYKICINQKIINEIEYHLVKVITEKTESDFKKFIYEK